jgi:hypothetical protein
MMMMMMMRMMMMMMLPPPRAGHVAEAVGRGGGRAGAEQDARQQGPLQNRYCRLVRGPRLRHLVDSSRGHRVPGCLTKDTRDRRWQCRAGLDSMTLLGSSRASTWPGWGCTRTTRRAGGKRPGAR